MNAKMAANKQTKSQLPETMPKKEKREAES